MLILTTCVIGIFQCANSGKKLAFFFLSLVPDVLIPTSLISVFSWYAQILKTQSAGPDVWPVMRMMVAFGSICNVVFVSCKTDIENMFWIIEVYDRSNHDMQHAEGRLG